MIGKATTSVTDRERLVSRPTLFRVALLFGPSVVVLIVLRLLQHALLTMSYTNPLGELLRDSGSFPLLILLAMVVLGWGIRRAWPSLRPVWFSWTLVLVSAGMLMLTDLLAPPWYTRWLSATAFQVVRWDLLVVLLLALVSILFLEILRGWTRSVYLVVLHVVLPLLLLLPIFELGTIMAMGSAPDGSLLAYTLLHLPELAPVLASEMGVLQAMMLSLPLLITLLPLLAARLPGVLEWLRRAPSPLTHTPWKIGWVALPLALFLALPSGVALPLTHRTISFAGITYSLFEDTSWQPDNLDAFSTPPFDARTLRFVETDQTRPMNVVVILLESFRSRSVTPYNPKQPTTTPFLDSLAQHALLVEQMYSIVTYTNKDLTPIFTGIYPELTLQVVESRPGGIPAVGLPTLLRPFGYESAFFTPAMLDFERKDQLLDNLGFDTMQGDGSYPVDGFYKTHYFGYEDQIMLDPSLAWVDEATQTGHPFFLSYLTLTTHHSYETPPSFERQSFAPDNEVLNDYLNAMHYTDAFLRNVFAAFEKRNLIESTLFVLVGDHGEAFGEHGLSFHGDIIWDEALQVPALLYNPVLFPEGRRIQGNRLHTDIVPTIADALGFAIEGGSLPGHSLLRPVPANRPLYHSARSGSKFIALRQDSLKFFYYHRRQPMQVFNLRQDPFEQHDIADQVPLERRKAVEMNILLWRRGVQQIYHAAPSEPIPLAQR